MSPLNPTRFSSRETSAESGFTVIEITVTMLLLAVVVTSLLTIFESVQRTSAFTQDRTQSLDDMRIAMARISKELRQASTIREGSSTTRLDIDTFVNGAATRVVYEASGEELTRTVGVSSAPVLGELASTNVFAYSSETTITDSTLVTVLLTVHPERRPDTTLALESKIRLRNEVSA